VCRTLFWNMSEVRKSKEELTPKDEERGKMVSKQKVEHNQQLAGAREENNAKGDEKRDGEMQREEGEEKSVGDNKPGLKGEDANATNVEMPIQLQTALQKAAKAAEKEIWPQRESEPTEVATKNNDGERTTEEVEGTASETPICPSPESSVQHHPLSRGDSDDKPKKENDDTNDNDNIHIDAIDAGDFNIDGDPLQEDPLVEPETADASASFTAAPAPAPAAPPAMGSLPEGMEYAAQYDQAATAAYIAAQFAAQGIVNPLAQYAENSQNVDPNTQGYIMASATQLQEQINAAFMIGMMYQQQSQAQVVAQHHAAAAAAATAAEQQNRDPNRDQNREQNRGRRAGRTRPTCRFYCLRGFCNRDDCTYTHPELPLNEDNLPVRGPEYPYCPEYWSTAVCSTGIACPYNHALLGAKNTLGQSIRPKSAMCPEGMKCRRGHRCDFNHVEPPRNAYGLFINPETSVCFDYVRYGMCPRGATCTFDHSEAHLNSLGYPIRPGRERCRDFCKRGDCEKKKFCRYDHPEEYVQQMVRYHKERADERRARGRDRRRGRSEHRRMDGSESATQWSPSPSPSGSSFYSAQSQADARWSSPDASESGDATYTYEYVGEQQGAVGEHHVPRRQSAPQRMGAAALEGRTSHDRHAAMSSLEGSEAEGSGTEYHEFDGSSPATYSAGYESPAVSSSEDYAAMSGSEDYPAMSGSEDYPTMSGSEGYAAVSGSEGYTAASGSEGYESPVPSDSDTQNTQYSSDVPAARYKRVRGRRFFTKHKVQGPTTEKLNSIIDYANKLNQHEQEKKKQEELESKKKKKVGVRCEKMVAYGMCPFGDMCAYDHDDEEEGAEEKEENTVAHTVPEKKEEEKDGHSAENSGKKMIGKVTIWNGNVGFIKAGNDKEMIYFSKDSLARETEIDLDATVSFTIGEKREVMKLSSTSHRVAEGVEKTIAEMIPGTPPQSPKGSLIRTKKTVVGDKESRAGEAGQSASEATKKSPLKKSSNTKSEEVLKEHAGRQASCKDKDDGGAQQDETKVHHSVEIPRHQPLSALEGDKKEERCEGRKHRDKKSSREEIMSPQKKTNTTRSPKWMDKKKGGAAVEENVKKTRKSHELAMRPPSPPRPFLAATTISTASTTTAKKDGPTAEDNLVGRSLQQPTAAGTDQHPIFTADDEHAVQHELRQIAAEHLAEVAKERASIYHGCEEELAKEEKKLAQQLARGSWLDGVVLQWSGQYGLIESPHCRHYVLFHQRNISPENGPLAVKSEVKFQLGLPCKKKPCAMKVKFAFPCISESTKAEVERVKIKDQTKGQGQGQGEEVKLNSGKAKNPVQTRKRKSDIRDIVDEAEAKKARRVDGEKEEGEDTMGKSSAKKRSREDYNQNESSEAHPGGKVARQESTSVSSTPAPKQYPGVTKTTPSKTSILEEKLAQANLGRDLGALKTEKSKALRPEIETATVKEAVKHKLSMTDAEILQRIRTMICSRNLPLLIEAVAQAEVQGVAGRELDVARKVIATKVSKKNK